MSDIDRSLFSQRGFIVALSAPSGGGKSTLAKKLLAEKSLNLSLSISATTRPPRGQEQDGMDYYFLSEPAFLEKIEEGYFLEWAKVHGNYYGTPRGAVEARLQKGENLLFDIDWQGVEQVKKLCARDLVSIFLLPPSLEELKTRLLARAEDSEEAIKQRLKMAQREVAQCVWYDYCVVNDQIPRAFETLVSIIESERRRCWRQNWLPDFIQGFKL